MYDCILSGELLFENRLYRGYGICLGGIQADHDATLHLHIFPCHHFVGRKAKKTITGWWFQPL